MRRWSNINLAVGVGLVALIGLVAARFLVEAFAAYPREGVIFLASVALGFSIAVARKLWT